MRAEEELILRNSLPNKKLHGFHEYPVHFAYLTPWSTARYTGTQHLAVCTLQGFVLRNILYESVSRRPTV